MITNEEKNHAPFWKKAAALGVVLATVTGLGLAQSLSHVTASNDTEFIPVAEFSAGEKFATIVSTDGQAYSRGWNNQGQLGIQAGSKVNVTDWTKIELPEKLVSVETSDHTVALSESGKLYTWGANGVGQIGDGTKNIAFTPVQIKAFDRYSKIASGGSFTVAIDSEGKLWSWGANNSGQLGDGTTEDRPTPKMVGDDIVFRDVYASQESAYAIDSEGKIWVWGDNKEGQLGDGTTENRTKPTRLETSQNWTRLAVSLENKTVLAIDSAGWLHSWGSNSNGLLGNGTDWRALQEVENTRFKTMIAQIEAQDIRNKNELIVRCVDAAMTVAQLEYDVEYEKLAKERAAAEKKAEEEKEEPTSFPTSSPFPTATASPSPSSDATLPDPNSLKKPIRSSFTAECQRQVDKDFIKSDTSQLKPAVIKEPSLKPAHNVPEQVTDEYRVKDIAIGSENAFVIDIQNRLRSWGKDANGQTGLELEDEKSLTQVPVIAQESVSDVDAGSKYGVAVASNGDLFLWGLNTKGTLMSDPATEPKLTSPTRKGTGYTTVIAGLTTVYGFKNQTMYSWGDNTNGELGVDATESARYSATEFERKISSVAPSAKGAVALGVTSQLLYWGLNDHGQFGNSKTSVEVERKASSTEIETFTAVATGEGFTTAIASDGRMWGWGSNMKNLLSLTGTPTERTFPSVVSTGFTKVTAIAAGRNVTAMTDGSELKIWSGGIADVYTLPDVAELVAGDDHVVARTSDGKVWNWSATTHGVREGTPLATLAQVDTRSYKTIAAGGKISGAITNEGETIIWGSASSDLRLADDEGAPIQNFKFTSLSIGDSYILASDENDVLWGWGENRYQVLGNQSVRQFPAVLTSPNNENNEAKEGK